MHQAGSTAASRTIHGSAPPVRRIVGPFGLAIIGLLVALSAGCAGSVPLPPKALQMNEDGARALAVGDLSTAATRLGVALEYSPRFTEAWVNLGLVELARGNLDEARRHFERARDLNPDLPAPHHSLGLLADRRGFGLEAEKHYRAALRVDPGFAPSRANLGRRLFERGAFDDAREQFARLTEVAPESLEGWLGLAESLTHLDRERESDQTIARTRARFGDAPDVALLVARQLLRRGAFREAEAAFAPLTGGADPSHRAAAWSWIAVARLGTGDAPGARAAVREALTLEREQPIARYALAVLDGEGRASAQK